MVSLSAVGFVYYDVSEDDTEIFNHLYDFGSKFGAWILSLSIIVNDPASDVLIFTALYAGLELTSSEEDDWNMWLSEPQKGHLYKFFEMVRCGPGVCGVSITCWYMAHAIICACQYQGLGIVHNHFDEEPPLNLWHHHYVDYWSFRYTTGRGYNDVLDHYCTVIDVLVDSIRD